MYTATPRFAAGYDSSQPYLIDQVHVTGVHGTVQNYVWHLNSTFSGGTKGIFGTVSFDDSDAVVTGPPFGTTIPHGACVISGTTSALTIQNNVGANVTGAIGGNPSQAISLAGLNIDAAAYVGILNFNGVSYAIATGQVTGTVGGQVTDTFQRANGSISSGGFAYTAVGICGESPPTMPQISSNKLVGTIIGYDFAFYSAQTFDGSQFAQVVIGSGGADASAAQAAGVRFSGSTGYAIRAYNGVISIFNAATSTTCAVPLGIGHVTQAVATGDMIKIVAQGNVIGGWYLPSGSSVWQQIIPNFTDNTYQTGSPALGVFGDDANSVLTEFVGESINNANPYAPVTLTDGSPLAWVGEKTQPEAASVTLNHATTRALDVSGRVAGYRHSLRGRQRRPIIRSITHAPDQTETRPRLLQCRFDLASSGRCKLTSG